MLWPPGNPLLDLSREELLSEQGPLRRRYKRDPQTGDGSSVGQAQYVGPQVLQDSETIILGRCAEWQGSHKDKNQGARETP